MCPNVSKCVLGECILCAFQAIAGQLLLQQFEQMREKARTVSHLGISLSILEVESTQKHLKASERMPKNFEKTITDYQSKKSCPVSLESCEVHIAGGSLLWQIADSQFLSLKSIGDAKCLSFQWRWLLGSPMMFPNIIGGKTEGLNELAFLAPTWRVSVRPSNQSHPLATVVRAKSIEMQKTLNFTT